MILAQIITTNLTASSTYTVTSSADDDFIFVADGVLVSNTSPSSPAYSAVGVFHVGVRLDVAGTLMAGASPTVYSVAVDTTVSVTQTGAVISLDSQSVWPTLYFAAGGARVFNDGQITGLYGAIFSTPQDAEVFNTGLISGNTFGVNGAVLVENLGTIRGVTAVSMSGGGDRLINLGYMVGNIILGSGDDLFDTIGGIVSGTVAGGAGEDVYRTDSAVLSIIELSGEGVGDRVESTVDFDLATATEVENLTLLGNAKTGAGNGSGNMLIGNFRDNVLGGGVGDDTLNGGTGNDSLRGDIGLDQLLGGDGDDSLRGGASADRLYGGNDDDTVWGGIFGDRLYGENGEDQLVGGAGRDSLYGGADADIFVFRAAADSGVGSGVRDVIFDCEAGLDLIDLSRMDANTVLNGNQAFSFIATGAFTNVAGQLRAVHGTNSYIQADVNGDGVADFEVQLNAIATVSGNILLL